MRKEIKQVHFIKLYSQTNIFDPIIFQPGVNLILGEKYSESSVQGRKTNGVGKSMCIEFLKFTLLSDYEKSRIKKIPEDILSLDELICLDFSIDEDHYTIMRSRKNHKNPTILCNQSHLSLEDIEDVKKYFSDVLYLTDKGVNVPSFRSLLSLLMREEKSEFTDILNCYADSRALDYIPHIYLLFISIETFKYTVSTYKEIEQINQVIKKYKQELTSNNKKLSDVKAELNVLDSELKKQKMP